MEQEMGNKSAMEMETFMILSGLPDEVKKIRM